MSVQATREASPAPGARLTLYWNEAKALPVSRAETAYVVPGRERTTPSPACASTRTGAVVSFRT